MEINAFARKVCNAVKRELGEGCQVEVKQVRKNNGVIRHGLLILSGDCNVAPTIYLDLFWESYEQGSSFGMLIRRILAIYRRSMPKGVDMGFFRSFEKVRDRICYRLVGRRENEELLREVPHIEFLDLAICFYYAYQGSALGEGSILLYDSHVEMWGTDTAELFRLANENTPRLYPCVCNSMDEILEGGAQEDLEGFWDGLPMKVLSNGKRLYGAASMIYPEVLGQIASRGGRSFYILPSSIHEVILLADMGNGKPEAFRKMIAEINSTQVDPEEVLSDSLYYYDLAGKGVRIIF